MHRREAVAALLSGLASPFGPTLDSVAREWTATDFADIERRAAGRLGVAVLDTTTERRLAYRADERFAMCSTFKWLLGALAWLIGNTTGAEKLRAGLPTRWRVGDKTGMGANGATNDVAIIWPVERRPVLIAAYLVDTNASVADRNDALAQVGRAVARWLARA